MEKIQNVRKPRRIAVATVTGLLAVVSGLGMAPADAAVSVEEGVDAKVYNQDYVDNPEFIDGRKVRVILSADIGDKGDVLSAEVSARGIIAILIGL